MNTDAGCSKHLNLAVIAIVRADLSHGSQVAQAMHAASEIVTVLSAEVKPGTIAVALHARDEAHLRELATALTQRLIPHHIVEECDGEWMAIGILTTDRKAVGKVTSSLPLVK